MSNLIFCFDGTSNDPEDAGDFFNDGSISNVMKLHAFFGGTAESHKNEESSSDSYQHSFYYSGIGTYGNYVRRAINSMFAPLNADMNDIIQSAEEDLKQTFKENDKIFIFGFSRGAAIARMFASKIGKAGKKIKLLGVFDTVAAIKGTLDLRKDTYPTSVVFFENGTIGEHIDSAVHLVSIDEKRIVFQPTLFNKDERVTEVWFAGVHSDIGGGYWFDGLSDVTLKFMLQKAKEAGIKTLEAGQIDYDKLREDGQPDDEVICEDDIAIKPMSHGLLHEQKRSKYIAEKTLAPRKIRVNVDDKESPDGLPIIHHTVCERFETVAGYRPYALRNMKYCVMDKNGNVIKDEHGHPNKKTGVAALKGDKQPSSS